MRKIKNPFIELGRQHDYNCFGCSPFNEIGLHLNFWEDGDELIAKWQPRKSFEGWTGVLHGGIQATLLDEMAGWVVLVKMKTAGVTAAMNVEYLKPLSISIGEITVKGKLISVEKRLANIECSLFDSEGVEYTKAQLKYFHFPEKIAKSKYSYPGIEAFYE
ncbi:MAG: PaaI family thioesterase [Prolixibacteraceae bacterium]|nr:PaaI family thioesterase [Prolixibacteraceae bacterium]